MKRVLRPEVITLAGIFVIIGLIAVPGRCAAQQAHSAAAVTEKRVVPPPTAPASSARDAEASADGAQPEATSRGATAKSGSLASRIRTITRYAPLRETQTT